MNSSDALPIYSLNIKTFQLVENIEQFGLREKQNIYIYDIYIYISI